MNSCVYVWLVIPFDCHVAKINWWHKPTTFSYLIDFPKKLTQKTCLLQFVKHSVHKQLFISDAKWKAVIGFNEVEGICKISKRAKNWIILSRCRGALH